MATQDLSTLTPEIKTPATEAHEPAIVSYTTKDGCYVDLDNLRHNLESIADDLDVAELMAREAGDIELAVALDGLFCEVDGLIPAVESAKGVKS